MATVLVSSIVNNAATLLQDTTNIRWPQLELVGWLCDGQREIVMYKPNACVRNSALKLKAGSKQELPAEGITLVDVVRNMGADGGTSGKAIRLVSREVLDAQLPDWHSMSGASPIVRHYIYSSQDPKNFYVYPPQPAANQHHVDLIYCASPPNVGLSDTIAIDDIYATALLDYVLYRAYSKDTEYAGNAGLAQKHAEAFLLAIKGKLTAEAMSDPNARTTGNPNGLTK